MLEYYIESRIMGANYRHDELEWLNLKGEKGWVLSAVVDRRAVTVYYFVRVKEVSVD